ncbi:MAG: YggT family protein [Candidatus Dormibacteria bacterium]
MSADLAFFIGTALRVYTYLIVARALGSFFIKDWSHGIPRFLYEVTEPALGLVRRFVPPIAGLDFSPMILIIGLSLLGGWLTQSALGF